MGSRSPWAMGNFWGYPALWKALSHSCAVRSKKSITAWARLLQPIALLPTGQCHLNSPCEKFAAAAMRSHVKILRPLVLRTLRFLINFIFLVSKPAPRVFSTNAIFLPTVKRACAGRRIAELLSFFAALFMARTQNRWTVQRISSDVIADHLHNRHSLIHHLPLY